MKRFFFFFFLLYLVPTWSSAQDTTYSLRVDYRMQLNFSGPSEFSTFLLVGKTSGYFEYRAIIDSTKLADPLHITDPSENYVYTNRQKRELVSVGKTLKGNKYNIVEDIPTIKWTITENQKAISGYNCFEAQCEFRGRNYNAWFAPEIPISLGPWKLNGLPGLILEAHDDTYEVSFTATSIKPNDSPLRAPQDFPRITRSEFKKLMKQSMDDLRKIIASKATRGTKILPQMTRAEIELD